MAAEETWLAAMWPFVRDSLPAPPARVVEIGCGRLGGFVPRLNAAGYQAIGIDPEAPDGLEYDRVEFEQYQAPDSADAVVACTSLHHVADLGDVLDKVAALVSPSGAIVVVEWARERFDEATARWCFEHLDPSDVEPGWLHGHDAEWRASGKPWDAYCRDWAEQERLHLGLDIVRALDARFDRARLEYGPYFFPDLKDVTEVEEQGAIDAGLIQAARIEYVGSLR